ncbi:hypothetical protein [Streptomyces sp. DH1]|uniref:hypothetical protein n=1 Tax=Streptomyces sp. DH1 TaxID=2857012 RepID=UPI001E31E1FB|nr:hypothetical protein [Streptomyces sp. DH1]
MHWEPEEIWPQHLHLVAGGHASTDLQLWRMMGRDPVILPEVVAVADALLDPAMAELVWRDNGAGRPRPLSADRAFCRRLGERWTATGWGRRQRWTTAGRCSPGWERSSAGGTVQAGRPGGGTIPDG